MDPVKYYLRQSTVIEPIIWNWYALPYLISPSTFPFFIYDKIKMMRSFIAAPDLHEMATSDAATVGRTFLNKPANQVGSVLQLLNRILSHTERHIEFADGVFKLNEYLLKEGNGYSLERLYKSVPEILKGYVELLYDINNQPGFRFFESLLYKSDLYDVSGQSFYLYKMNHLIRGHVLDTPRLDHNDAYELKTPFVDASIDKLSRLKSIPQSLEAIKLLLPEITDQLLNSLFTQVPPDFKADRNYDGRDIRIRFFGHACVLLQTSEVNILIDPFISYLNENDNYTFSDLPDHIDYVLITHNHGDHIILEYLLQLRYKIKNIVVPRNGNGNLEDPSLKRLLKSIGFENVIELDELDSIKIPGGEIIGLPFLGEHCDLNIHSKILHLVKLKNKSILLASDSSNLEIQVYKILKQIVGEIDIVFLGMESEGAPLSLNYGPFMPKELNKKMDHSRRVNGSDFESGYAIIKEFNPKEIYVYAMGLEPWTKYILGIMYTEESVQLQEAEKLISAASKEGIHAELLELKRELILNTDKENQ
ncbi:MBL fold metallo-hydrolase [Mucilaginibacter sp. RCC_168]|uniref:MBL fold metallo-hydrolase n=1 Tax=Mucilaginibacter sp. RCC_168 TaxID=3239221 RepID=UPI0035245037